MRKTNSFTRKQHHKQAKRSSISIGWHANESVPLDFLQDTFIESLEKIQQDMRDLALQESSWRKSIRVHMERAKARQQSDNSMGAVVSMWKSKSW